ncbi:MAG: hypothetical protein ACN0LA_09975 [Candidatus Longimicrobiales bacterium M2_2A_002]
MSTPALKTTPEPNVCGAPTDSGDPCATPFGLCEECGKCFVHCEHRAEERRAARAKGARHSNAKRGKGRAPDVSMPEPETLPPPESMKDCAAWFSMLSWAVTVGRLHPDRADKARAAVRDLRDLLLKDQDKRIDELQAVIQKLKKARKDGR